MNTYKTLSKIVYKIQGEDAVKIINGLTTNEMTKPLNTFLDRFGKLIALVNQKIIEDSVYLVFENKYEQKFLEHLKKYIKLSKSKIEKQDLKTIHVIEGEFDGIKIQQNTGYLLLTNNSEQFKDAKELSEEEYTMLRIENNIPTQGIDFEHPMFLETNLHDAVSFKKGCYLGQEIIARVHNLSKPPKILARLLYNKIPEKATINNEEIGQITSKCFSKKHNKYLVFAMIKNYDLKIDDAEILSKDL